MLADILADPDTEAVYVCSVSKHAETFSISFVNGESANITERANVGLTAAALLDGIARNDELAHSYSTSEFIEAVHEDAVDQREHTALDLSEEDS